MPSCSALLAFRYLVAITDWTIISRFCRSIFLAHFSLVVLIKRAERSGGVFHHHHRFIVRAPVRGKDALLCWLPFSLFLMGMFFFLVLFIFFYFFPWLATGRIHYADERIRHEKKTTTFHLLVHFFFPLWWERKKKCPTNCCRLFSQSHHLISSRRDNVFIRLAMTPFPRSRLSTSQQLRDHRVQQHSTTITNFLAETKIESMPKKISNEFNSL